MRDNERGGVLLDWPVCRSKVFSDRIIYRVEGRLRDSSASPAEYSVLYEGLDTRANLYPGGTHALHLLLRVSALRELLRPDGARELLAGPPTDELAVAVDPAAMPTTRVGAANAGGDAKGSTSTATSTPDWVLNALALSLDADRRLVVAPHRFDRVVATATQNGPPARVPVTAEKQRSRQAPRTADVNKSAAPVVVAEITERTSESSEVGVKNSVPSASERTSTVRSANASEPNDHESHLTRRAAAQNKKAAKRQQQQHQHQQSNSSTSSSVQSDSTIPTANPKAIPASGGQPAASSSTVQTGATARRLRGGLLRRARRALSSRFAMLLVASPTTRTEDATAAVGSSGTVLRVLLLLIFVFLALAVLVSVLLMRFVHV